MNEIERHIDFVVCSCAFDEQSFWTENYKPIRAVSFYKRGYEDRFGMRYFFGNNKSPKAMVVASGETLINLRDAGRQDPDVLAWLLGKKAIFTRLDLAVTDYIGSDFLSVGDVQKWYENKKITSSHVASGAKFISGYDADLQPQTQTFYVGDMRGRGKKGIFRAYDKSLDLGIGNEIITRIEIELRGSNAHQTAKRLAENDDISGNFRAKFNVDSQDFERLMDSPAVKIQRGLGIQKRNEDEKLDARWKWLMEQVAPSLKDARENDIASGRGSDRMYWFLRASGMTAGAVRDALEKFENID